MSWIALIDATRHTDSAPPGLVVAGLSLLERAVRLAKVSGCVRALIATCEPRGDEVERLAAGIDFGIELEILRVESQALSSIVTKAAPQVDGDSSLLYLRSSTVYDRGLIRTKRSEGQSTGGFLIGVDTLDGERADVLHISASRWPEIVEICAESAIHTLSDIVRISPGAVESTDKWQVRVTDPAGAKAAAERLWSGCRKPVDGIVSRWLNRYISLAISRSIAATAIRPNHISIVTFSLGAIAAVCAATGGYWWFVLAGIAYQTNSVVDGVDGELARVRYEFSLLGEWLDTLSDDTKDVLFYAGLAVGAWRTVEFPGGFEPLGLSAWLWLGGIAVAGKLVSMVAYYTWLIANKRGDLLAFEWSFETQSDAEKTALSRALSGLKYLTKNDFIVFLAMVMAVLGALPYFLFIVAPGQFVVATSVIMQRIQGSKS
jgi:phosphatidylglycerophosphate synthase